MKQVDITVAVCTYNRAEILRDALETLVSQQTEGAFSYEVVVVDNSSTDNTKSIVEQAIRESAIPVRYAFEPAGGIAAARNRGVQESLGRWIAIFDDDQLAEPDWLAAMHAAAKTTGADCVGGTRLLMLSEQEGNGLPLVCRSMLGEIPAAPAIRRYTGKRYPCDGNVMRTRRVHNVVGPFDCAMALGGQDQDFSRRVAAAGFEMWHAPEAVVHHRVTPSMVTVDYFRWHSLRSGANYAYQDHKHWGRAGVLTACLARMGQTALINLPWWVWARVCQDECAVLARSCRLWRAKGYLCSTLSLIMPRLARQQRFFSRLEFRSSRTPAFDEPAAETGVLRHHNSDPLSQVGERV